MKNTLRHSLLSLSLLIVLNVFGNANRFTGSPVPQHLLEQIIPTDNEFFETFKNFSVYEINLNAIAHYVAESDEIIAFGLHLGNTFNWEFSLEVNDLRSAKDFTTRVKTQQGIIELPKQAASTYKGSLTNFPGSRVRLSIRENTFSGLLIKGEEEFFVESVNRYLPESPLGWIVVYRTDDVVERHDVSCGTPDVMSHFELEDFGIEPEVRSSGATCMLARIAIAADGAMVTKFNSVVNVENEILDIFNVVEERYLFPEINIGYEIATIFISSNINNDPWNYNQDFGDYLSSFRSWGQTGGFGTTNYALASLWTNKNFTGSAVGLAYISAVCSQQRYNANIHYTANLTRLVQVQTHEMGHNWSAQHTAESNNTYIMSPSIGLLNDQWHPNSINSIINHKNSRNCIEPGCKIAPIANFVTDVVISCNGVVNFIDNSYNEPTSWLWEFGDGTTSTQQNPSHTYQSNGAYTVKLITSNEFGEDQLIEENYIFVNIIEKPLGTDDERCGSGEIILTATGTDELIWYNAPVDGDLVFIGNDFSTILNETTSFWVETSIIPDAQNVGEFDKDFANGEYFTSNDLWGMYFDVHAPVILESFKVFSNSAANRRIEIFSGATTVFSEQIFIPQGESRVELNLNLTIGQDYLIKLTGSTVSLFRNDGGAQYPYQIQDLISITGNNTTTGTADDYYYYFYDWKVREPGCVTPRTEVTAIIKNCEEEISSVKESIIKNAITVFPNPSNGKFETVIELVAQAPIQFEIYNAIGQMVYQKQTNSFGVFSHVIDISNHASGIYNLRMTIGDEVFVRRLVVE